MTKRAQVLFIIILLQSLVALLGSLYFSNVLLYAPCDLCWYQRIAMYPQAFIAAAALWRKDASAYWYGLPLALVGLGVSVFHSTIYIIENYTGRTVGIQCSIDGISCTTPYLIYGMPVPFLSLGALVVTVIAYLLLLKESRS